MKEEKEFKVIKPHGNCCVITAKPPESMIENIVKFREEWHFNSRNDAILVLVANGLRHLNLIGEEELKQYMELYAPLSVEGDVVR